jgi:hypothetical protein
MSKVIRRSVTKASLALARKLKKDGADPAEVAKIIRRSVQQVAQRAGTAIDPRSVQVSLPPSIVGLYAHEARKRRMTMLRLLRLILLGVANKNLFGTILAAAADE